MIMMTTQARVNGIGQLEILLRHTEQFEFTELSLDILRVLRLHYGLIEGDEKRYSLYESRLRKYETLRAAESEVESLYTDLVVRFVNRKADRATIAAKAAEYQARISGICREHRSFKVQMFGRLIDTIRYDSCNDFAALAGVCEDTLRFFEQEKRIPERRSVADLLL